MKFLEISSILKECGRLQPETFQVCQEERTIICHYIGEFLPSILVSKETLSAMDAVLGYLALLDTMFPRKEIFQTPRILRGFLELSGKFPQLIPFISETKDILPRLKQRGIWFCYGSGIGNGLAIPHGKSNLVKIVVIAIGFSRNGIDFNIII